MATQVLSRQLGLRLAGSPAFKPLPQRLLSCLPKSRPASLSSSFFSPLLLPTYPTTSISVGREQREDFIGQKRLFSQTLGSSERKHWITRTTKMTGGQPTRGFSVEAENSLNNIHYRIVPPSRYEDVIRLLYGSFFTDEPMSKCLGLTDGIRRDPILDEFVYAGLEENLSIMAIDASTGKLLGACINVSAVKNEVEETLEDSLQKYKDSSFRQIVHVLYNVNRDGGDIFGEMDSNILFDIKMIAADKHNRKGGLATDLLRRSVDLAKCLGFKGIKTEATGLYSRKAFQRIGFEVKAECIYEDFVTLDGEKIFIDAKEPHRCTTLMTKKI